MTVVTVPPQAPAPEASPQPSPRGPERAWRQLFRHPLGLAAAAFLALVVLAAVIGPIVFGASVDTQDLAHTLAGPSAQHWLGTDRLGRDILIRLIVGSRVTLVGVGEAMIVFLAIGVTLGLLAGFLGGWFDRVIVRFADLILALPAIIIMLMVLAVLPGNDLAGMAAFGVIGSPAMLRIVRGATLAQRNELYVKAARLSGLSTPRVIWRHILPRVAGPIIVQGSLFAASGVLVQASLSFLGLLAPDTQGPSWGNMIGEASNIIGEDAWMMIPTGGIVILTVLALGLLGDTIRDITVGRSQRAVVVRRRGALRPASLAEPQPETGNTLLTVAGLSVAFGRQGGDVLVLRDVSFDIRAGEALGIVGESGCGKTMTARSVLNLLPPGGRIVGGSIRFDGQELVGMSPADYGRLRGSRIALISQEPMNGLDPTFRVGSQLMEVIRRHTPMARAQARARALELLDMVELPEGDRVIRLYPHELSGGMAQRVAIALALAAEPDLLIADEPTTALDVTVQAGVLQLLRDLQARLKMAVLLITHDWGVLADLCDRAVVMYAGEVVEQATAEQLYREPRHPYTRGLLASNPHRAEVGKELPAIPGSVPPPGRWPSGCHFEPRCPYATPECAAAPIPLVVPGPGRVSRCIHTDRVTPP